MQFATKAIRVGQTLDSDYRAVIQPIYQSATFGWEDLGHVPKIDYTRCGNPNRSTIEQVIAALENGGHGLAFSSGMAAVTAALSVLEAGDHLVMASDIYGGTHRLCHVQLRRQGVEVSEFNATEPDSLRSAVRPNTKAVIYEGPTNPTLRVIDIAAVAGIARELGILSIFDNTFASPYLQNPLDLGCDVVVHSTTKYICGHSDVIGGAIVTNRDDLALAYHEYSKTVGSCPSPFDCWLTLRGLKTLSLRMRTHCENAIAIAKFLDGDPRVACVHFPGLTSHPDHALAKRQMRGFGGMISFIVKGSAAQARQVAESTRVILLAESLGGVESLIGYPPLMSHATMTEEQRIERGMPGNLLRLSVGIEDVSDLIADLDQALTHALGPRASIEGRVKELVEV